MFTSNWRDIAFTLCKGVLFSSSFFLFFLFRLLQTCYCGWISTISSQAILKRKQAGMTYWINTQLSILPMQIERKSLASASGLRKAQWKTWYMHPFSLAIKCLWRDDSYITASQNFEANTWQPSSIFFYFLPASSGNQGSYRHHRTHFISLVLALVFVVILRGLSMTP